jgi:hypothetical protein
MALATRRVGTFTLPIKGTTNRPLTTLGITLSGSRRQARSGDR